MLAVHVSTSVLRVLFQRARSIQSTPNSASIAVLVQVFVLQRLSTKVNKAADKHSRGTVKVPLFYLSYKSYSMKTLIHIIVKSAIITAIGVACYFIYTELLV